MNRLSTAPKPIGLSRVVEEHLVEFFKAHHGILPGSGLYDKIVKEIERPLIKQALKAVDGNKMKASKLLGMNRNTLRKKMRELNII
jgi:two-component system nitrogen regulation response regulator GlnG